MKEPTMDCAAYFDGLGREIDRQWGAHAFDEEGFGELAAKVLDERAPSANIPIERMYDWCEATESIPHQHTLESVDRFGDHALTVYQSPRFFIDALFWADGTTSIHQHGFDGAFHVLHGGSIHSEFTFEEARRYSTRIRTGRLRLKNLELLRRGSTRVIRAGGDFIHSLFHLDQPSVTIVVRTGQASNRPIQFSYERAGLAYDPFTRHPRTIKRTQLLDLYASIEHPDYAVAAERMVRSERDPLDAYRLVRRAHDHRGMGDDLRKIALAANARFEGYGDTLLAVCEELERSKALIAARRDVRDRDLRFLLAVLLNVRGREETLRIVRQWTGDPDPVRSVLDWTVKLRTGDWGADELMNDLGFAVDDAPMLILEGVLRGMQVPEILDRLRGLYASRDVDDQTSTVTDLAVAFRRSALFQSLFAA